MRIDKKPIKSREFGDTITPAIATSILTGLTSSIAYTGYSISTKVRGHGELGIRAKMHMSDKRTMSRYSRRDVQCLRDILALVNGTGYNTNVVDCRLYTTLLGSIRNNSVDLDRLKTTGIYTPQFGNCSIEDYASKILCHLEKDESGEVFVVSNDGGDA